VEFLGKQQEDFSQSENIYLLKTAYISQGKKLAHTVQLRVKFQTCVMSLKSRSMSLSRRSEWSQGNCQGSWTKNLRF